MAKTLRLIRTASRGRHTMIRCPTTFFVPAFLSLSLVLLSVATAFFFLAGLWATYDPDTSFAGGLD